jgi:hypothetical protein
MACCHVGKSDLEWKISVVEMAIEYVIVKNTMAIRFRFASSVVISGGQTVTRVRANNGGKLAK